MFLSKYFSVKIKQIFEIRYVIDKKVKLRIKKTEQTNALKKVTGLHVFPSVFKTRKKILIFGQLKMHSFPHYKRYSIKKRYFVLNLFVKVDFIKQVKFSPGVKRNHIL